MVKRDLYITQSGNLIRKQNTIWFENSVRKRPLPVAQVNSVYCFGDVNLNTNLFDFFTKHEIPIYFFNYYGYYSGMYAPRRQYVSGNLLIRQVEFYRNGCRRLEVAKEFLLSAWSNMLSNLSFYGLEEKRDLFLVFRKRLENARDIQGLMLEEAKMRQVYYSCFNDILKGEEFEFIKRVRQPPDNFINCLISWGNSVFYTIVLTEILKTQLDPTISYLHEPFERRYSLNLDISEIFKPVIVDKVIFKLVNSNLIKPKHFDKNLNYCYLNDEGRKIFSKVLDEKLSQTVKCKSLGRKVSLRTLIRLECYKLIKLLIESKDYEGYKC